MYKTVKALVLREVRYKEADRILTLFTDTDGKMTVKARGALRKSSRTAAATQQLVYGELTLFGNRGRWMVNEASLLESFKGLREDIENYALGCYVAECLDAFSMEEQADPALLQLGLNTLYALSNKLYPPEHIKAAFEMRLMCISGYTPDLSGCYKCGCEEPEEPVLDIERGAIGCRDCAVAGQSLCPDSLRALRYIASAGAKQIFSFKLEGEAAKRLYSACEKFLLKNAERGFATLDYWKSLRIY